ncbi:MAG: RnfABCDGE type electron transport complex subunit B [Finegoldia sp.]|nr:RnfABCDGE type electron transport complex subunit B [Finegoldia sp.]
MSEILTPFIILGVLGIVFALLLGFASRKFYVPVDRKVAEVREALPGANCGACGFPGCDGLANAIVNEGASLNSCPVGGQAVADEIALIMGADGQSSSVKEVACVMCQGKPQYAKEKFKYKGIRDCRANNNLQGGSKACPDGCLGCGTCVDYCEFDALHIVNGVAKVDEDKCVACKKCIKVCPRHIIRMKDYNQDVYVRCNSHEKGKEVRKYCSVGCIGCGICTKMCPEGFELDNNLAYFNYDPSLDSEKVKMAIDKCPTKAIYPGLEQKEAQAQNKEVKEEAKA